jgi:Sap-like sulfolipid-1-addressing protein
VGEIFLLSMLAAFNPTLLGATTLMLLLENPKLLMFGYLLGAMLTSITLGMVIVFAIPSAGAVGTTQHSVSPSVDIALGGLALIIAFVLGTGRDHRLSERRHRRAEHKDQPPRWQRQLSKGSARVTFVMGALLTLPGASYVAGLARIKHLDEPAAVKVLLVLAFNLIMLALIEIPLVCFVLAPSWTPGAIDRAKAWIGRNARRIAVRGLTVIGVLLVLKGVLGLLK